MRILIASLLALVLVGCGGGEVQLEELPSEELPSTGFSSNVYPDEVRGDLLDRCRFGNNSREYCFCILRKLEEETLYEDYDTRGVL